jgi:cysteine-rich repeat protein
MKNRRRERLFSPCMPSLRTVIRHSRAFPLVCLLLGACNYQSHEVPGEFFEGDAEMSDDASTMPGQEASDAAQPASDAGLASDSGETGEHDAEAPQPVCGDGLIEQQEQCDDGNDYRLDGCDDHCMLWQGFTCSGEPSRCLGPDLDPELELDALTGEQLVPLCEWLQIYHGAPGTPRPSASLRR